MGLLSAQPALNGAVVVFEAPVSAHLPEIDNSSREAFAGETGLSDERGELVIGLA